MAFKIVDLLNSKSVSVSIIADFAVIIGAIWAIVLYILQIKDKRKSIITLIVNEIEEIDKLVSKLIELNAERNLNNFEVYKTTPILTINYWEKNKYIIIKKINKVDASILDEFYYNATQIERARKAIIENLNNSWYAKNLFEQKVFSDYIKHELYFRENVDYNYLIVKSKEYSNEFNRFYSKVDSIFTPEIPILVLQKHLNLYKSIISSTTYSKLLKMSFNK